MKNLIILVLFSIIICGCTTIHFRSNGTVPVSFEGNPKQQQEVSIIGHRNFYFWGLNPEEHVVYVDEEVRKAGYDGISKVILYEQKNPQDILISFLTFGLYLPRGYTITGYSTGEKIPNELEDTAPQSLKK